MNYEKPNMELFQFAEEDVILTSQLEVDPTKPFPEIGEDGEDW